VDMAVLREKAEGRGSPSKRSRREVISSIAVAAEIVEYAVALPVLARPTQRVAPSIR
jgi:hypothetical protein